MLRRQIVAHQKQIMTPWQNCNSLSQFCVSLIITEIKLLHIPKNRGGGLLSRQCSLLAILCTQNGQSVNAEIPDLDFAKIFRIFALAKWEIPVNSGLSRFFCAAEGICRRLFAKTTRHLLETKCRVVFSKSFVIFRKYYFVPKQPPAKCKGRLFMLK